MVAVYIINMFMWEAVGLSTGDTRVSLHWFEFGELLQTPKISLVDIAKTSGKMHPTVNARTASLFGGLMSRLR